MNKKVNNGRSRRSTLIIFIDNIINELLITYRKLLFLFQYCLLGNYKFLKKNKALEKKFEGQKFFIIGLGPSLKNYDLLKLKDKNVIMVNRSFRLDNYSELSPKFHLFIDPKLEMGIWPIDYLDEILKKSKNVKIFLNADWFDSEKFLKFRNHEQIYWIKIHPVSLLNSKYSSDITQSISSGSTVIECAITLSMYLGSNNINILGVEGNGISKLMCNQDSHWDGSDPDYKDHNSLLYANDMINASRGIRQWHAISKALTKKKIKIYNLTKEGILDAYEYKNFEDSLN
tara:strand:- start:276 stop:1136 length:861 start_codon:yes stop_codon:yes gene_type:complete